MANDAEMTCPLCQSAMSPRFLGNVTVHQCSSCQGVFLERADLGNLIEAENDWHRNAGQHTAPLPRITADMTAPPAAGKVSRAWVETLFG